MKMPHVDDEYMNLKAPQHRGPPPPPSAHRETSPSRALPHSRKGKATTEPTSVSAYGFPPEQYPPHHPAAAGHLYPPYHHPFGAPRPHASAFNDLTHATNVHMPHPPPPPSSSPHIPPPRYEQYPYEGGHFPHPYPPMPHPLEQGAGGGGYSYYHHHPDARPLLPPMHHHQHPSSSSMGPPPPRFHPYTEVPPPYHHGEQQQHYTHFLPPSAAISSSPSNKSSGSSVASLTPRGSMDGSEYSPDGQYQGGEQVNEVGPNDVLCGRGAPTNFHPGNEYFRELVQSFQYEYLRSKRADKPLIASKIVSIIHSRGGRFLRRHKRNGVSWERGHFVWEEIDPQKSYEKACQALREGAPELRRKLQLSGSDDGDDSTHNTTAAISSSQANNNTREQRMQDTNTPAQVQSKDTGNDGTATSDGNSEDDRNDAMQDSGRS